MNPHDKIMNIGTDSGEFGPQVDLNEPDPVVSEDEYIDLTDDVSVEAQPEGLEEVEPAVNPDLPTKEDVDQLVRELDDIDDQLSALNSEA